MSLDAEDEEPPPEGAEAEEGKKIRVPSLMVSSAAPRGFRNTRSFVDAGNERRGKPSFVDVVGRSRGLRKPPPSTSRAVAAATPRLVSSDRSASRPRRRRDSR